MTIPQRWEDDGPGSMHKSADGFWCIFAEAEKWVQEEIVERDRTISRRRNDLCDRRISLQAALKLCKGKDEEIVMLGEEIAALKEKIKERDRADYCPTCGACGEDGCCPPDTCEHLKCFYGEHYAKTYRDLEAENATLRCLVDGATEIVEIYAAERPAQKMWKVDWLAKARGALK